MLLTFLIVSCLLFNFIILALVFLKPVWFCYITTYLSRKVSVFKQLISGTSISKYRKYMVIRYYDEGRLREVYVPRNLSNSLTASQCAVTFCDGNKHIVQDMQIPILVTARDLDTGAVCVKNVESGNESIFRKDEKVIYVE